MSLRRRAGAFRALGFRAIRRGRAVALTTERMNDFIRSVVFSRNYS